MDIQNDNFNFKVDDNETKETIDATISISRTYGVEEENRKYLVEDSSTYELFWDRVEYLLGLKKNWSQCNPITSNGFICDILDLDNDNSTHKNLIDLNTTVKDKNITKETINLSNIYNRSRLEKTEEKTTQEDTYIIKNSDKISTEESSVLKNEEKNSFIKVPEPPIVDRNATKKSIQMVK